MLQKFLLHITSLTDTGVRLSQSTSDELDKQCRCYHVPDWNYQKWHRRLDYHCLQHSDLFNWDQRQNGLPLQNIWCGMKGGFMGKRELCALATQLRVVNFWYAM